MKSLELLRQIRTGLYRSVSPFEKLLGRRDLPPLWLRRHVGDPAKFESAAEETAAWIDRFELVRETSCVLDIGCGCGAMVGELASRLGTDGRYVGFDVHAPSVRWCRRRHADDPRLAFELAPIASPYAARPGDQPLELDAYRFPLPERAADFVLAKSVFTHLLEDETRHYLAEIRRVLAPGGAALITFFLFDGENVSPPAFPHPDARAEVRWRLAKRPHAAVAYSKQKIVALIEAAGLRSLHHIEGFWPGESATLQAQDQLILSLAG